MQKKSFSEKVFSVVSKIPRGQVLTYKQVTERIGNSGAYRVVGSVLNKNNNPQLPCHRVIRSDGKTGGYNKGERAKERILREEGFVKKQ